MKGQRFSKRVRHDNTKELPYIAYITDKYTGMKFMDCFSVREDADDWIEKTIGILSK